MRKYNTRVEVPLILSSFQIEHGVSQSSRIALDIVEAKSKKEAIEIAKDKVVRELLENHICFDPVKQILCEAKLKK